MMHDDLHRHRADDFGAAGVVLADLFGSSSKAHEQVLHRRGLGARGERPDDG
jgi:hypothetical protein